MSASGAGNSSESGRNEISRRKRTREEFQSFNAEKMLRKEKTDKLIVKFDTIAGKSVNKPRKTFNKIITQIVRDAFPPWVTCWEDVPETSIEVVYYRLRLEFVYPHDNATILDEIERLQKKALRDWQYNMKRHWKKLGGEQNKEAPMGTPYENIDIEDWQVVCDIFSSKKEKDATTQTQDSEPAATAESATSVECGERVALEHSDSSLHHHYSDNSNCESCEKDKIIAYLKEQIAAQKEQIATQKEHIAIQKEQLDKVGERIANHGEQLDQLYAHIQKMLPGFQQMNQPK